MALGRVKGPSAGDARGGQRPSSQASRLSSGREPAKGRLGTKSSSVRARWAVR